MMHRVSWALTIAVTVSVVAAAQGQAPSSPAAPAVASGSFPKSFAPPRTPWGDPDLQGVWPGTEMVGVPLQRPQQFGNRNVLTDQEFQDRVRQAKQTEEDALAIAADRDVRRQRECAVLAVPSRNLAGNLCQQFLFR